MARKIMAMLRAPRSSMRDSAPVVCAKARECYRFENREDESHTEVLMRCAPRSSMRDSAPAGVKRSRHTAGVCEQPLLSSSEVATVVWATQVSWVTAGEQTRNKASSPSLFLAVPLPPTRLAVQVELQV